MHVRCAPSKDRLQHSVVVYKPEFKVIVDILRDAIQRWRVIFGALLASEQCGKYLGPGETLAVVVHPVKDVFKNLRVLLGDFISRDLELTDSLRYLVRALDMHSRLWMVREPPQYFPQVEDHGERNDSRLRIP
jgi:hypothetical protein